MRKLLVVVGFLCLAGSVQAELWVEIDDGVDLGEGLYSYTVHLMADVQDNKASAWDGSFDGPMNQVLAFGALSTPTLTNASYLSEYDRARDSHFLQYDADLLTAVAPNESDNHLAGAMGFKPEITAMDFSLAQIVVASGQTVTMAGQASDESGTKYTTQATIIGGEGGFACSHGGDDPDGDGVFDLDPGQDISFQGVRLDPSWEYWVVRHYTMYIGGEAGPGAAIVFRSRDPDFDFVIPDLPGTYVVQKVQLVCGEGPMPTTELMQFNVTPEPACMALLGAGALLLLRRSAGRRKE